MDALLSRIKAGNAALQWESGIRGLTLRFDFLEACGVAPEFLRIWRHGQAIGASGASASHSRNHPSCYEHEPWVEHAFDRLDTAGKIQLFAPGQARPPNLNVNPCALILKLRPDTADDVRALDRFKARLIVDLRRGRIN